MTPPPQNQELKLLSCPFCGSANIDPEEVLIRNLDGTDSHSPGCMDCGATAESNEAWNKRANDSNEKQEVPAQDYAMRGQVEIDPMKEYVKRSALDLANKELKMVSDSRNKIQIELELRNASLRQVETKLAAALKVVEAARYPRFSTTVDLALEAFDEVNKK